MKPPLTELLAALSRSVLDGPAVTSSERRRAAAGSADDDSPLGRYLRKVREHAHRITTAEIEALKASGASDDELFELTVAAALGQSRRQLDAALAAVDASYGEER